LLKINAIKEKFSFAVSHLFRWKYVCTKLSTCVSRNQSKRGGAVGGKGQCSGVTRVPYAWGRSNEVRPPYELWREGGARSPTAME